MKRKLQRARSLSAGDGWLLAQAWVLILVIDLGLRFLRYATVRRSLHRRLPGPGQPPSDEAAAIQRVARLVDLAARLHLYPMTCLRRSLALQWLLRRRGIDTELRFGVRRVAGDPGLEAHAWLERHGHPVSEPEALTGQFTRLAR